MIKKIVLVIILCLSAATYGQNGTASPYSFGGLGIVNYRGTVEYKSMGGMSVFSDSLHLNLQNPATYANLRYTTYTVGGRQNRATQKTDTETAETTVTTLDYLAIGIPMGKFGAAFGLYPYSSVGYQLDNETEEEITNFSGTGGITKVFLGLGYEIMPGLNLGVEAQYNFGNIRNQGLFVQTDIEFGTQEVNRSDISGLNYNFGLYYKTKITENLELTSTITYIPETKLTVSNFREIATVIVTDGGGIGGAEIQEIIVEDSKLDYPSQFSIGAGIGKPNAWFVGVEYISQKTGNLTNRSLDLDNITYIDATKVKLGGFYTPKFNSLTSYWNRITYRAGVRFEETGLQVSGEDINEFGISFGLGLPVGRKISNINLGFEVGKRGTTDLGLVQENFFNVFVSLSLNDKWFIKRKYD